ncbi:hypothetical protein JR316_0002605 [Psilocybe cubensis]|uniref:Uncharacterized protein n=2 Tax=Psilocybe cubensis TaxID=181762 RepID=A0ACB8HD06_PSICU|nr:hypothetical protein JR316_0002605 [Psilocybe cubensis]KAH9485694.1 hypothetical protein JR316_0002605 [Psilocybe cubensis]
MQAYSDNPLLIKAPIGQQPYSLLPTSEQAQVDDLVRLRKKRRARRFGHALVSTLCLGYLVYLASKYTGIFHHGHCGDSVEHDVVHTLSGIGYTIPSNVSLVHCVDGTQDRIETTVDSSQDLYESRSSFQLPLDSATIFLVSRGQNLHGAISVVTSEDQEVDSAKVVVSLYHTEKSQDWAKVCLLSRGQGENGVGIFTPIGRSGHHWDRRSLSYSIAVILPALDSDKPLQINNLETDLPNTSHHVGDLSDVLFDRISLRATNAPMNLELLVTDSSSVITTNGPITGTLHSSLQSVLTTTNGPIKVNVNLTSTEQSNATLIAHATNSPINAKINLLSSVGNGGTFFVSTTTTNSPLSVDFLTSPVDSTLHLVSKTTNGFASVALDPAYEGSYDIATSRYLSARVHHKVPVPEDPSGKGRPREGHAIGSRNEVRGEIYWGRYDENRSNGTVFIRTTNSPVLLDV